MSGWRHNRDHYAKTAQIFAWWAGTSLISATIFFIMFIIDAFQGPFGIASLISLIAGMVLLRLKSSAQKNYWRAPSFI
jgi:hypothetical protein